LKPHPCFEDRFILTTEYLGEGSFGKVYVGKDLKHVGQKVAVKVIDKSKMSEKELRFIREELETMRVLNDHFTWSSTNGSRGIVKLIDIFEDQTTIKIV
jgi:serine/threonine protein kinase